MNLGHGDTGDHRRSGHRCRCRVGVAPSGSVAVTSQVVVVTLAVRRAGVRVSLFPSTAPVVSLSKTVVVGVSSGSVMVLQVRCQVAQSARADGDIGDGGCGIENDNRCLGECF